MGIFMKDFPGDTGINHKQIDGMNPALVNELKQDGETSINYRRKESRMCFLYQEI